MILVSFAPIAKVIISKNITQVELKKILIDFIPLRELFIRRHSSIKGFGRIL